MRTGQRALGYNVFRRVLQCLPCGRFADFQRDVEIILHHPPGPAVTGAPFDDLYLGIGKQTQHFGGLCPHILRPRMTGKMHCHATFQR